jgi:CheY-like chemotaxis protein
VHLTLTPTIISDMQTVLIVARQSDALSAFDGLLIREGYEILRAEDGLSGLVQATFHHPDLILCDSAMPHLDGVAFVEALRAEPNLAPIPVVMMSDTEPPAQIAVEGHLRKPFEIHELFKIVEKILAS